MRLLLDSTNIILIDFKIEVKPAEAPPRAWDRPRAAGGEAGLQNQPDEGEVEPADEVVCRRHDVADGARHKQQEQDEGPVLLELVEQRPRAAREEVYRLERPQWARKLVRGLSGTERRAMLPWGARPCRALPFARVCARVRTWPPP